MFYEKKVEERCGKRRVEILGEYNFVFLKKGGRNLYDIS